MNFDSLVKQLANRINQPQVIRHYLLVVWRTALKEAEKKQLHIPVVVRSVSEIEKRLCDAIGGMKHSRECGNEEIAKEYERDVNCLFWVLGRSGGYDYIDGKVVLHD